MMLSALIDDTKRACEASLREPDLLQARSASERAGVGEGDRLRCAHSVTPLPSSQQEVNAWAARAAALGLESDNASLERLLLIEAALHSLPALPALRVCESVKELLCAEFQSWTCLDHPARKAFRVGTSRFVDMCWMASLRRFPAGQFDWDLSGLPLSYLLRVAPRALPRALYVAAVKLKGRRPVFFSHLGYRRPTASLTEVEANRSYYRMAKSLELQPAVKGLVASSWIRSPDTHRVSPHLAWLNKVFLENGGFVAVMGPANPNGGVFVRSDTRKRLYERGEFKPTIGLVIWPRKEMLAWAHAHPEWA